MPEDNNNLLGDFFKLIGEAKKTEVKPEVVPVPLPPPPPVFKQIEEKIEAELVGKVSAEVSFLSDLFKTVSEGKQEIEKKKVEEKKLDPLINELESVFSDPVAFRKKKKTVVKKQVQEETIEDVVKDLPQEVSSKIVPEKEKPEEPKSVDIEELEGKFKDVVRRLQDEITTLKKTMMNTQRTGWGGSSGGGEVNLRYLDDVDRSSIADGRILSYHEASKKFRFIPRPTGGGGNTPDNIVIEVIPISGFDITINLEDYGFTHAYALLVVDNLDNEVSVVIQRITRLNIRITSLVDLTGLFLVAAGI